MQLRYIGHAGFALDVAGQHVVCDPWWNGPAFAGQWYPFPQPAPEGIDTTGVDIICLSHGHEDHLHVPTLRTLRRDAMILVPRLRDAGLRDFVRSLGFDNVRELVHGRRCEVTPGLHVTAYVLRDDSVMVFEAAGRTLVNANDALQSVPRPVVDDLCDTLRACHPRVDVLLARCGGGGWHQNGIQITDDVGQDAAATHGALLDRFAAIAHRLGARVALPLQPAFLCLDEPAGAANGGGFDVAAMRAALQRAGAGDIEVHLLAPGDRLVEGQLRANGGRRATAEAAALALRTEFAVAVAERRQHRVVEPERIEALAAALRGNARARAARALHGGAPLRCRIDLRDVPEVSFWLAAGAGGAELSRCDRLRLAPLVLTTRLDVLEALAFGDYGDEAIRLGGGATLQLRRRDLALAEPLLLVLGRRPLPPTRLEAASAWLRDPRRAFEAWRRERHLRLLVRRLGDSPRISAGGSKTPPGRHRSGSASDDARAG